MCQAPAQGSFRNSYLGITQGEKKKKIEQKNYLQVLCSALESLWGLPFTFYFILILGLKYCTHTCHVAMDGLYPRWSVCCGTWTNEGFIDEWSHLWDCLKLVYMCNCNLEEKLSSLFTTGRLKTKCSGLCGQDWSFMMLFLNYKAHHSRVIFCWCAAKDRVQQLHHQPLKPVCHCGTQGFLLLYLG